MALMKMIWWDSESRNIICEDESWDSSICGYHQLIAIKEHALFGIKKEDVIEAVGKEGYQKIIDCDDPKDFMRWESRMINRDARYEDRIDPLVWDVNPDYVKIRYSAEDKQRFRSDNNWFITGLRKKNVKEAIRYIINNMGADEKDCFSYNAYDDRIQETFICRKFAEDFVDGKRRTDIGKEMAYVRSL